MMYKNKHIDFYKTIFLRSNYIFGYLYIFLCTYIFIYFKLVIFSTYTYFALRP